MKLLVTGGCGYKGSVLVPRLIEGGHTVTVVDACWFGTRLPESPRLALVSDDIRTICWERLLRHERPDAVVHLAGIANDPCGELDAKLTWEVNVLATMRLADGAARAGVKRIIFASSASVYGIKDEQEITEDMALEPVSDYNKTKMVAERALLSYADDMAIQIVRPATVCGYSPRMRVDTMVNMLTTQALEKGVITAHCGEHGGGLMRPNITVNDIAAVYLHMIDHPELTGVYNAGFENLSAMATAELIASRVPARIEITMVKDKRSYRVNSDKLLATGFRPKERVADAIDALVIAHGEGRYRDEVSGYNLRWMQQNGLAGTA